MADRFAGQSPVAQTGPASHGETVVPHDTNALTDTSRALYIGSAGNLAVVMASGATPIFKNVPAGSILTIRVTQVLATGTTAADIISLT